MNKPRRAHEITVNISADTVEDAADELRRFADRIEREGLWIHGVIGGVVASSRYSYSHDPAMTLERYKRDLTAWLQSRAVPPAREDSSDE